MHLIAKIAAHKVIATVAVVVVIGGGAAGGVVLNGGNNGNTCNGVCGTSVPNSGPTTFTPATWKYRVDSMSVCINNDFGFDQIGGVITPLPEFGGNYCMVMTVSIRFNGQNVELTPFPAAVKNGLPSNTDAWCGTNNDGAIVPNTQTVTQCGINDQSYPDGWQQFNDLGLGPPFSGQSYPVLTFALPVNNTPWQYIWSGKPTIPAQGQPAPPWYKSILHPGVAGPTRLYLMENMHNTETVFMVPFEDLSPEQSDRYPWVRAHINASDGKLVCDDQGDPNSTDLPDGASNTPGEGDVGVNDRPIVNGNCPKTLPDGKPTVVNGPVTVGPPQAPVSTCISGCPTPPANPSAAAIAAWKATANDASNIVGAALRNVASLLPASEDTPQIVGLNQLATILLAELDMDTLTQQKEAHADITVLDNFFGTPGLIPGTGSNTGGSSANPSAAARAAWLATGTDQSNVEGDAFRHVTSLLPSSDTAQIADLSQLAGIPLGGGLDEDPPSVVAQAQADIKALDQFFSTPGFTPAGANMQGEQCPGNCQSASPSPSSSSVVTPGHGSPPDAVDGFYQGELTGEWATVCSYVTPSAQALCLAGTSGQGAATGQVTVGPAVISGNEALVSVTGSICAPSTPCVANSDPSLGMPPSPSQFAGFYQQGVANGSDGGSTVISPLPCSQVNGEWYVAFANE